MNAWERVRRAVDKVERDMHRRIAETSKGLARDIEAMAKRSISEMMTRAEIELLRAGRVMRPAEIARQHAAEFQRVLKDVANSASERAARQAAAYRTIVYELTADTESRVFADIKYEAQSVELMQEARLSSRARPVFGLHFEMDSPFAEWAQARNILKQGMTEQGARYVANQAKTFLIEWYSEFYARLINEFYTVYFDMVNPRSGKAITSNRMLRALGVQFDSLDSVHIGLFGNRYLRWIAYKLEDGGYIHPKRAKALTVPNPKVLEPVHNPPWRRARLHRTARLVWFKFPARGGRVLGIIAVPRFQWRKGKYRSLQDDFEEPLYWLRSQVYIRPKRFWSRTVEKFERRAATMLPRVSSLTWQQWERYANATRKRVTLLIKDLGVPEWTSARLARAPKTRVIHRVRGTTGPKPFFQVTARYLPVRTLISPNELKPIIRRLMR